MEGVIEDGVLVPDTLVRAIARNAFRMAETMALVLDAIQQRATTENVGCVTDHLPADFLLEFAAVLELRRWELAGLRDHLNSDLPSYQEAASQLAARAKGGRTEFDRPDAAPLSIRVLRVWVDQFAWDAQDLLGVDVLIRDGDEDAFVSRLAEFLWSHRRELLSE